MSSKPRGKMIIINQTYFTDSKLGPRDGSDFDKENLKTLFQNLHFVVEVWENKSSQVK